MNRIGLVFLLALCALLSYFLAGDNWLAVGGLFALILGINLWLSGCRVILILWLIGSPTLFVFANNILQVLPAVTVERLLFVMLVLMILLQRIFSPPLPAEIDKDRNFFLRMLPLEKAIWVFIGWLIFTWVLRIVRNKYTVDLKDDFTMLLQYILPMAAFTLTRFVPWSREQLTKMHWAFIGVGIFLAMTSIAQQFLGITWFVPTYMKVIHNETRATGTFGNASEFGLVQSSFLIIGLFVGSRAKDKLLQALAFGCCVLMISSVVFSETRAPLVGLALGLAYLFVADRTIRPLLIFLGVFGVLAGMVILPLVIDLQSLTERLTDIGPIYNRLALWVSAIYMAISNPLVGVGFGRHAFHQAWLDYAISIGPISAQWANGVGVPHNEYLHIAAWSGWLGFLIYLFLLRQGWCLIQQVRFDATSEPWMRDHAIYVAALWINYLANGLWVDTGNFNYIGVLVFALMGAIAHRSNHHSQTTQQHREVAVSAGK